MTLPKATLRKALWEVGVSENRNALRYRLGKGPTSVGPNRGHTWEASAAEVCSVLSNHCRQIFKQL